MILIYDTYWHEIQEQDWPEPGMVFVCLDSQNRFDKETWLVCIMGNGTVEDDIVQQGLFWKKDNAILFAEELDRVLFGENGIVLEVAQPFIKTVHLTNSHYYVLFGLIGLIGGVFSRLK